MNIVHLNAMTLYNIFMCLSRKIFNFLKKCDKIIKIYNKYNFIGIYNVMANELQFDLSVKIGFHEAWNCSNERTLCIAFCNAIMNVR